MEESFEQRIKKLNIESDSELARDLKKLDEKYGYIEFLKRDMKQKSEKLEQEKDDVEVMEALLEYKLKKAKRRK